MGGGKNKPVKLEENGKASASLSTDDEKEVFWVSVRVDKVNDLDLFTDGVYSFEVAFDYDKKRIEPYKTDSTTWAEEIAKGTLKAGTNDEWYWNSDQYEIKTAYTDLEIDTQTDRENLPDAIQHRTADWRMCTASVVLKEGAAGDLRFKNLSSDGNQYLIKLPFKLLKAPAPDEADQNPPAITLVRGPEALDIGSGADGTEPFAAWEATVKDPADQTNMKNLFEFGNDLSLFDKGGALTNIEVYKYIDPSVTPTPVPTENPEETPDPMATPEATPGPYPLSNDETLGKEGFTQEQQTYYVNVPNDAESITLRFDATEGPSVEFKGSAVTVNSLGDRKYETDPIALDELNPADIHEDDTGGYSNEITVTSNGVVYTIHVRRLLKPEIKLNPGNSPYGLIELMSADYEDRRKDLYGEANAGANWDAQRIQEAKDAFKDSHLTNKTYGSGYIPTGAQTDYTYTTVAWGEGSNYDESKNYDMNENAIFVYESAVFTDPGFAFYNQLGKKETSSVTDATKKLNLLVMPNGFQGVPKYTENEGTITEFTEDTDGKIHLTGKIIRPDIYEMVYEYSYMDVITSTMQKFTASRPVIVLSRHGDVQLTQTVYVNNNDANELKKSWAILRSRSLLMAYRSADVQITTTPYCNNNDANELKKSWAKGYTEYYISLN